MEVYQAILKRRSIRKFKPDKIPENTLEKLKNAIIWAPSAGNLQSRIFYFVFNEEKKKKLAEAAFNQIFIKEAPLVIVGCCDLKRVSVYGERGKKIYSICDVSAAVENLMLLAVNEGLGTCWIGAFDEERVSRILKLPKNEKPMVIVPVGYPLKNPEAPPRNEIQIKEIK